ncbi:MAG TPA: cobyric acid synthase [bacterium]|nr:cobyric acid synthase [bacterium]
MVQGTGSGVGKSVLVSALCRIFLQDGWRVAPFKAQNMALNSFVTAGGGEIGRAQAAQAAACRIAPTVDINPILIKPTSDRQAQIIVHGKPVRNMSVYGYKDYKRRAFPAVKRSFDRLSSAYDIVVIEGAGSPAEINLRSHDIVNMEMARHAKAPVILAGDIDKGGVFAWLVGTLQLLTAEERAMVKGFIINKFRGDKRLLMPGVRWLDRQTGVRTLGVVPYYHDIRIPEEDSVPLDSARAEGTRSRKVTIDVVCLPHISNFTDFDPLERETDVALRYVRKPEEIESPDVIVIPGTKNTVEDLSYLKRSGLARKICETFERHRLLTLVGICGGYQILGESISDVRGVESKARDVEGLKILPVRTGFCGEKILAQVCARHAVSGEEVRGYEIHHGRTALGGAAKPVFEIVESKGRPARRPDGAASSDGRCWGTYIHGLFDADGFRRRFLNAVRERKGWRPLASGARYDVNAEFDKLARLVRDSIDMKRVYEMMGI